MKRAFAGFALAVFLALPAGASTFIEMSREQMVAQADAVVTGRVVEVSSFWNREGTLIVTEAVIQIEDSILGRVESHLRVQTAGGEVDGVRIDALGFPTFIRGEKLLLFLEPPAQGVRKVLGYRQGEFRIRADEKGREMAVPTWEPDSVRVLKADGTAARAPRTVLLEDFKREIRQTADRMSRPQTR